MEKKKGFFEDEKVDIKMTVGVMLIIMVTCGVLGFIYETIFYRIDLGYFVKRGSSFGPWVPIYAFGGLLLTLGNYKLRKHPIAVLMLSAGITGALEYITGMVLWEVWHTRLWDYNIEIWNWGNINGYICFRSVALFAFSGLALVYLGIPAILKLVKKMPEKVFYAVSYGAGILFFVDIIIYMIIN